MENLLQRLNGFGGRIAERIAGELIGAGRGNNPRRADLVAEDVDLCRSSFVDVSRPSASVPAK